MENKEQLSLVKETIKKLRDCDIETGVMRKQNTDIEQIDAKTIDHVINKIRNLNKATGTIPKQKGYNSELGNQSVKDRWRNPFRIPKEPRCTTPAPLPGHPTPHRCPTVMSLKTK